MTHGIVNMEGTMERTHSVCSDLPAYKTRGHAPLSLPQTDIGDSASDRIAHTAAIISQPYTHNATNIAGLRRLGFPLSTVERGSGGEVKRVNGVRSNYSDFYSLNI